MSKRRLVLASANPDKAAEMAEILGDRYELVPRPGGVAEVDESAETLEGNARLKAEAICAATGLPALADDTGLEVDALGGAPGVHSARYAADSVRAGISAYEANVARLLSELAAAGAQDRRARFRSVVVVAFPDGGSVCAEGTVGGHITETPRGTAGFGYDPVFVPDEGDGRTFAEMSPSEKHALSHRGRALRALVAELSRCG